MSRTVSILLVILVIQIGLYLAVSTDRHYVAKKEAFLSIDTSMVDFIKIRNDDGELVMKRVGNTWKVKEPFDYRANQSYVQTLLEKMAGLKVETLVSKGEDKYTQYELDDLAARYIEIGKDGGDVEQFYCGKVSDSYTHTYMRKADSKGIYLIDGTPRSTLSRQPDQWRDKKILELDKTLIERILLEFPTETIELTRSITVPQVDTIVVAADTSWMATPESGVPFEPEEKVMNRILNTLRRMNATDFIDAATDTVPDFSSPDFAVSVFLEGNQKERIEFIPKVDTENRWIARKNGVDATVFIVYKNSVNNLKKDTNALKGIEETEES